LSGHWLIGQHSTAEPPVSANAITKGVCMSKVVQISRTVEALRHADFAARARRHHHEAERLRCQWQEAMDAELASPIETPKDAYAKLWWARYWIGIGADDEAQRDHSWIVQAALGFSTTVMSLGRCCFG
jgi:hypothetical protein